MSPRGRPSLSPLPLPLGRRRRPGRPPAATGWLLRVASAVAVAAAAAVVGVWGGGGGGGGSGDGGGGGGSGGSGGGGVTAAANATSPAPLNQTASRAENGTAAAAATPRDAAHCGASWTESGGFFCEPPASWALRKGIYAAQAPHQMVRSTDRSADAGAWWQANYEPNFSCAYERRLGNTGDGGKWVCDPSSIPAALGGRTCVVYSVGSGGRFGFEAGVHEALPGCRIYTFDHTAMGSGAKAPPPYVRYLPYGLGAGDRAGTPFRGLGSIRRELGHEPSNGRVSLEILKVDIEGAEYGALLPWLRAGALDGVRQLLIEIHGPYRGGTYERARELFAELDAAGWVITHKEPNLIKAGTLVEYAFLKLDWKL